MFSAIGTLEGQCTDFQSSMSCLVMAARPLSQQVLDVQDLALPPTQLLQQAVLLT